MTDHSEGCEDESGYILHLFDGSDKQGSHVCSEIPSTKEKAREWFNFEEKLLETAMLVCDECVVSLIKAGADVAKCDEFNCTALMKAARYGHLGCVNLLIQAGAVVNSLDKYGVTALGHAVQQLNFSEAYFEPIEDQELCIKLLLRAIGTNVNNSPDRTETVLMSVAAFGDDVQLRSLIEAGADVNRKDRHGCTALIKAAGGGHFQCVEALLEAGADVNVVDMIGMDALKDAALAASGECVRLLIQAGSDVTNPPMDKDPFLFLVVMSRGFHVDPYQIESTYRCIQQFLKVGAYVNCPTPGHVLIEYLRRSSTLRGPVHMLLLAAGEIIGGSAERLILKDYMKQEDQDSLSLMHLCRMAVRKQMITNHPHDNLFQAVPKLGIPSTLKSYLLYDMSLNDNDYNCHDFYEFYCKYGPGDDYGLCDNMRVVNYEDEEEFETDEEEIEEEDEESKEDDKETVEKDEVEGQEEDEKAKEVKEEEDKEEVEKRESDPEGVNGNVEEEGKEAKKEKDDEEKVDSRGNDGNCC